VLDLIKKTNNPLITIKKDEIADITLAFQLLNNDVPVDLTGTTLSIAISTPNRTVLSKPCTITDATAGYFNVLLDGDMYAIVGDYSGQIYWFNGPETNITDKIYYESVLDIPI
jgi:BppU N-terminal domain